MGTSLSHFNLAMDYITLLEIHGLTFICSIDGCRLTAEVAEKDFGVVLLENTKNHFTWKLTRQTWKEVLDYLFHFIRLNGSLAKNLVYTELT